MFEICNGLISSRLEWEPLIAVGSQQRRPSSLDPWYPVTGGREVGGGGRTDRQIHVPRDRRRDLIMEILKKHFFLSSYQHSMHPICQMIYFHLNVVSLHHNSNIEIYTRGYISVNAQLKTRAGNCRLPSTVFHSMDLKGPLLIAVSFYFDWQQTQFALDKTQYRVAH